MTLDAGTISNEIEAPSRFVVIPGRIKQWLDHPERGVLNVSCTVKEINLYNPYEDWHFASTALRGGAGVNLILNGFRAKKPKETKWHFYLLPDHSDYPKMELDQWKRLGYEDEIIQVADSMSVENGTGVTIERSWFHFFQILKAGELATIDLSQLRPAGTTNAQGLTASGPLSFYKIYDAIANYVSQGTLTSYLKVFSTLNEVLRRGGHYKNGAVTTTLDWNHPDILEYINLPLSEIPYLKKAIRITND